MPHSQEACVSRQGVASSAPVRSLYIHVPYCRRVCPYCSFAVHALNKPGPTAEEFLRALDVEIRGIRDPARLTTIFFGGGTPSALPPQSLQWILTRLGSQVDLSRIREITVECNPEDVDAPLAEGLVAMGVTRVSLGVQSLRADALRLLGRRHSSHDCRAAVDRLRAANLRHLSVDIMIALPGQTIELLDEDIDSLAELGPDHVSCYSLSFDSGTPFDNQRARGTLKALEDEPELELFRHARTRLTELGLEPYEVSNFAKPGHRCLHNLGYWRRKPHVGIGPSAVSFVAGVRRRNHPSLSVWTSLCESSSSPVLEREVPTVRQAFLETLMLGLRCRYGLNWRRLRAEFGIELPLLDREKLRRFHDDGLLVSSEASLRATRRGLELVDHLAESLVIDLDPADR